MVLYYSMLFAVLPFTGDCDSNNVEKKEHEKVLVKCNNIFGKKKILSGQNYSNT